jgi:alkylation response protein AidB-like acyl-CoA dehydrogenase
MTHADLDPDEIREEFRSSVRAALAKASRPHAGVWESDEPEPSALAQAAALGWTGLLVDEQYGGAGAGMLEATVVAEELGGHLSPMPYLSGAILAVTALSVGGSPAQREQWLPGLASGSLRATVAMTGPDGRLDTGAGGVRVVEDGASGVLLVGEAGFVLDAVGTDLLVVTGRAGADAPPRLFLVEGGTPGVTISDRLGVDRSRRLSTIVLDGVRVDAMAELAESAAALNACRHRATVALAADATGAARRALDLAVTYAGQREQFGRPIGSFQAIKHKLADMYLLLQGATLAVEAAAKALDEGEDVGRMVAIAGSYAFDAASKITGDAIQVHGGIGYTWEHDCHRLFKRAKLDELYLGDPMTHREVLAGRVLASAKGTTPSHRPIDPW